MKAFDGILLGFAIGLVAGVIVFYEEISIAEHNAILNQNDSLKQELSDCNIRNGRYFHALIYKDQNKVKYDSIITILAKDN